MTREQASLLARLDERTEHIKETLDKLQEHLDGHFVTKDEFKPVRNLVYGCTGVILTAVITGLIALVIK